METENKATDKAVVCPVRLQGKGQGEDEEGARATGEDTWRQSGNSEPPTARHPSISRTGSRGARPRRRPASLPPGLPAENMAALIGVRCLTRVRPGVRSRRGRAGERRACTGLTTVSGVWASRTRPHRRARLCRRRWSPSRIPGHGGTCVPRPWLTPPRGAR